MPVSKKKSIRKAAPAAKKAAPHKQRRRKKVGVTSAVAKQTIKKYGPPQHRLVVRREWEKTHLKPTPLKPDDQLVPLKDAAARLGMKHSTLRTWMLTGKVIYRRLGGVLLSIPESEIEKIRSHGN